MSGSLLLLILISFMLLLVTGAVVTATIIFFVAFRRHIHFLYTEYLWVIFGVAGIGMVVSAFLDVALSLGILSSSRIDRDAVNMFLTISSYTTGISLFAGILIYNLRQRNPI